MSFWTDKNFEPKRANRFRVSIDGSEYFYVKDCTKPNLNVAVTKHKFAGRTYNFPGSAEWQSITMTFVDSADNIVVENLVSIFFGANYGEISNSPITSTDDPTFIPKNRIVEGIAGAGVASMTIQQLNADGAPVETWDLYNPIIEKMELDSLDYGKDDLSTYKLTIQYDWATLK